MTIGEYVCGLREYRFEGSGGLALLEPDHVIHTVSCADCRRLHDVTRTVDRRSRAPLDERIAALDFACPVDASHAARPWTDGDTRRTVEGAVTAACPRCGWEMRRVRTVLEVS